MISPSLLAHAIYMYYGQEELLQLGNCSELGFQPIAIGHLSPSTSSLVVS
jgi:hypothetical protein